MTAITRAAVTITAIATVAALAEYGDRIGQAMTFCAIASLTVAQRFEAPRCKPNDPTIYIGGVLMAGCPNQARR